MSIAKTVYARALFFAAALLAASSAIAEGRWTFSADGAEVTDNQSGLRWRRCSEGQTFSAGTCVGAAGRFTHAAALARAKAQAGWRLPTVKELSSIVDTDRQAPSIDIAVFPATSGDSYWSSSPYAGNADFAWYVYFYGGYVSNDSRSYGYHVRLVR